MRGRPLPTITAVCFLWTRVNYLPHHSYIFIFTTRLHVFVQIHQSMPISCNFCHISEKGWQRRERQSVCFVQLDCVKLELTFGFVSWPWSKLEKKALSWEEEGSLEAHPGSPTHHLYMAPIPSPPALHFICWNFQFSPNFPWLKY